MRAVAQYVGEVATERVGKGGSGALRVRRPPKGPPRVTDMVFDRRAIALAGVSPLAMREMILEAAGNERFTFALGFDPNRRKPRTDSPLVRGPPFSDRCS